MSPRQDHNPFARLINRARRGLNAASAGRGVLTNRGSAFGQAIEVPVRCLFDLSAGTDGRAHARVHAELLPVCWGALMTLDMERAAANLETCREME